MFEGKGHHLSRNATFFVVNRHEYKFKSSKFLEDSDGDLISDKEEILYYKTDPSKKDSDGDGIDDFKELSTGRDPLDKDN